MALFKDNSVHWGVMSIVKQRIADAQKEHNEFCSFADEKCEQDKRAAENQRDSAKAGSAEAQIKRVLGNLI